MSTYRETFVLITGYLFVAFGSIAWVNANPAEIEALVRSVSLNWNFAPISAAGAYLFACKLEEIEYYGEREAPRAQVRRIESAARARKPVIARRAA